MPSDLYINPNLTLPSACLFYTTARASGPGGQNVNKTSSKVQLRFELEHCDVLEAAVKNRLRHLAKERLDADGNIYIISQVTRSLQQNIEDARERLADLIRQAMIIPKRRKPTKPTKASRLRRVSNKRKLAEKKQGRKHKAEID